MTGLSGCATVVFAKVPLWGTVKTRLAAARGEDFALKVYRELLQQTASAVASLPHHVAFAGDAGAGELADYFPKALSFFAQQGATPGERQKGAFLHCLDIGHTTVCIIGCDCPSRTAAEIAASFDLLGRGCDAAFGPAQDGGYYLIAGSAGAAGLFDVNGWGTSSLLRETLERAKCLGLSCRLLRELFDIDTLEDYYRWKEGVP
jgi:rSAM/selenodomain-associated transferase 1